MSFTLYPNQFKMRENGQYAGLGAIKGDTGDTGAQGPKGDTGNTGAQGATGPTGAAAGFGTVTATVDGSSGTPTVNVTTSGTNEALNIQFAFSGLKGDGIGGGTFIPLVSFANAQPTSADNNTIWMKDCTSFTLGEVMLGTTSSRPSTRPDGTTLQSGDVYVMGGKGNNHPIVWGNVTFYPFRTWVYNGSAWMYKDAECKSGGSWWPMNSEWFVENGVIIGPFTYPSTGTSYYDVNTVNGVLVMTAHTSGSGSAYLNVTAGTNVDISTDMFTNVMEGTLRSGSASSTSGFGALAQSTGGSTTTHALIGATAGKLDIPNNSQAINPIVYCFMGSTTGSSLATVGFYIGVTSSDDGLVAAEIRNWYRVFGDITGT